MRTQSLITWCMAALLCGACAHSNDTHDGHDHADDAPCEQSEGKGEDHEGEDHGDEIILSAAQLKEAGVKVETVHPAEFAAVVKVSGQLRAAAGDECTIVAPMSGVISLTDRSATEGCPVRSGQTVASVSARNLQDGDPAERARLELAAAEREFRRAENLVADKIISRQAYEEARSRYELAKAAAQGTGASGAKAGMSATSPMSGYIKARYVNEGDYVNVGDPVMTVTQTRRLQLRAEVPESRWQAAQTARSANFRTAGSDSVRRLSDLNGRLISAGRTGVGANGTLPITFELDNVGNLPAGAFAEVYLLCSPRTGVISLPATALTEEQGAYFVYVEVPGEAGSFHKREVQTGQSDGVRTEITAGLHDGERVAVRGAYRLKLAGANAAIPHGHEH